MHILPKNLVLFLCTASLLLPFGHASAQSASAFYPLAVGDYWQYDSFAWMGVGVWDTLISEINRDTTFDGHTYFIVNGRSFRYGTPSHNYQRIDSSGDALYGNPNSHTESLNYRLSDTSRTWWRNYSSRLCRFDSCGSISFFGTVRPVLYVGIYADQDSTLIAQQLLVEGLGSLTTLYFVGDIGGEYLHGARINGMIFGTITSARISPNPAVIKDFSLLPPYPNPFNPETSLQYILPRRSRVQILIYDILGRPVTTILDRVQDIGTYLVHWNASAFPSGIYVCQMLAGNQKRAQKLLLIK